MDTQEDLFIPDLLKEIISHIVTLALTPATYYKICLVSKGVKEIVSGVAVFQTPRVRHFLNNPDYSKSLSGDSIMIGRVKISKYEESIGPEDDTNWTILFHDGSSIGWANNGKGRELDCCNYLSDAPNHEFIEYVIDWIKKYLPNYTTMFPVDYRACGCGKCRLSLLPCDSAYTPTPLLSNLQVIDYYRNVIIFTVKYDDERIAHVRYDARAEGCWNEYNLNNLTIHVSPQGNYQWLLSRMALSLDFDF